jgi:2-iminobutanoate/2-iminopropanoate deaminase
MTTITKLKTGSPAETRGSYSRAVCAGDLIFVSNTAGRNPETKLIPADPGEQTRQVLANIERALNALDAVLEDVVAARVFIQFPEDIDDVMVVYADRMRGIEPTLTLTSPPLGSAEFKVEIEVTAWRGASRAAINEVTLAS